MATPKFQPPKNVQSDRQLVDAQYSFKGAWMPDYDPAKIGPENFKTLVNMRYIDGGIEGCLGFTKITTSPLSTYTYMKGGMQLISDRTQKTYVLVQAAAGYDGQGRIYELIVDIPSQGTFVATQIHADLSVNLEGRFSSAPGGSLAYCNSQESKIYSGYETRAAGLFSSVVTSYTGHIDYTIEMNNTLSDSNNTMVVNAGRPYVTVFSTRPLSGVKFYIASANSTTSSLTGEYWGGSGWVAVSNKVDGTLNGGRSLYQDGIVSFDSTVSVAKPMHFEGLYLYAYRFTLSAGSATLYHVSVVAPFQDITDIWDGVYRQPIQFQFYNATKFEDYTLHVNEASDVNVPIGALIDGMLTTDYIYVMFEEQVCAMKMIMLGGFVNANTSNVSIKYWDGAAFQSVSGLSDTTSNGGKTFGQSGLISWTAPAKTAEKATTMFGTTGYLYKVEVSATLSGTKGTGTGNAVEVMVDICTGIPAQNKVRAFKFPGLYKGRLMLGGFVSGKEGNRMDYSMKDAADVFNGFDSSMDGIQSLYFGGMGDLSGAVSLYNRFGSQIFTIYLVYKNNETYILDGDNPENFKIFPVSYKVGCPCPQTIDTAELGFEMAESVQRNVAIWVSFQGPIMFDGAVMKPITGIDSFFDPSSDYHVNFNYLDRARGWVDNAYKEYNLLLPMGSSTYPDCWVIYDMTRKKWWRRIPGASAKRVVSGIPVRSSKGVEYVYGGTDDGNLMRIENGTDFDGVAIIQKVETGDFWPSDNIWHQTRVRFIKVVAEKIDANHNLSIYHYKDTDEEKGESVIWREGDVAFVDTSEVQWSGAVAITLNLSVAGSTQRLARTTGSMNKLAWSHGFGFEVVTSTIARAFRPIMWGIRWEYERHDFGTEL